jgi:excisionase family DNA binding protein
MPASFASISDIAARYGVSQRTVRRWIARGLIEAYRVGPRLLRVDPDEVDALLRKIPAGAA